MGTVVTAQTTSVASLYLIGFDYGYDSASQAPFVGSVIASVSYTHKRQIPKFF